MITSKAAIRDHRKCGHRDITTSAIGRWSTVQSEASDRMGHERPLEFEPGLPKRLIALSFAVLVGLDRNGPDPAAACFEVGFSGASQAAPIPQKLPSLWPHFR